MGNVFFVIILYVLRIDGTLQRDTCEGLEEGTRLPHSTQCDRFIICRTQRMYSVGRCPRGLHFNRRLGVCDFKLHARCDTYLSMPNPKALSKESIYEDNCCSGCNCNCNSIKAPFYETAAADDILLPDSKGPSTGPSGTTCNNKGICENQPDGAMFLRPGSNGYIVCQCECEIPMSCPPNLIFNSVLKVCDWQNIHPHTESTLPIRATTVSKYLPAYDTSSTLYRSSTSSYLSTSGTSSMPWDSTPTRQIAVTTDISSTPNYPTTSGTASTSSDTKTKSATSTTSNPAAGPSGTTCNNKGVCENQSDGAMFPNPETNGYIVCQCECEIPMPCPSGLIFNPVLKVCDWPVSPPATVSPPPIRTTTVSSSTPKYPSSSDTSSTQYRSSISSYLSSTGTSSMPWDSTSTTQIVVTTDISSTPNYPTTSGTASSSSDTTTKSATSTTSNPAAGPSGTTCNNKGVCENQPDGAMFPNPETNGYIVCQCECEIPMPCPSGLIFNPVLKVCDWPVSPPATVSPPPIRTTTVSSSTPKHPSSSDTSSTQYRSSISSYLSSTSTSSMPWDSTSTTQIAVTTDISSTPNYPTTSGTVSSSSDTTTKSATSTTSNPAAGPSGTTCNNKGVCENQPDGAMFPNPETNGYIVCQCECEIPMPCPSGLIFNPVLKVCDWPVSPPATVSPPPIRTTTVSSSTPKHPSSSDTSSTQYRSSISSYLSSTSTSSMPWDSTSTTQIAVTTDISSTPNYPTTSGTVSSSSDTTTKSATSTTSNPAAGPSGTTCNNKGVCENQPDGAMFPNPETNGYIVCQCECEIPMPCPSGLIFNPLLKVCDWPRSDVISASSPSTGPSGTVCNNKGKCNGQKDGTLFADPNTSGFIVCQCECEVIMPCPTGLTFNPSVNVCDWPQTFL